MLLSDWIFFTKQEGNKELVMEGTGSFNSSGNYAK